MSPVMIRVQSVQLLVCSVGTPHWVQVGLVAAYIRAASRISSLSIQVISSTLSRGYSLTLSLKASQPLMWSATNALSYSPSSMITLWKPMASAASVPGRIWRQRRRFLARKPLLGSITISLAPFLYAFQKSTPLYSSGLVHWGLHPHMTIHLGSPR